MSKNTKYLCNEHIVSKNVVFFLHNDYGNFIKKEYYDIVHYISHSMYTIYSK